jgi:arsenite methyltransferase
MASDSAQPGSERDGVPALPPGSYGVDAPYVPLTMLVVAALLAILSVLLHAFLWFGVLFLLLSAASYMYATRRGKFTGWARILDPWQASPPAGVLDVGCGRGMVAVMAAERFPDARVVGLDIWQPKDQSGNKVDSARENAREAGVEDRVAFVNASMVDMPLPDDTFDAVCASVAIQNVKDRAFRRRAIAEMLRVARPGARIAIVDIQYTRQYEKDLVALGAETVQRKRLGPGFWYGGPWSGGVLVSARAPGWAASVPTGETGNSETEEASGDLSVSEAGS